MTRVRLEGQLLTNLFKKSIVAPFVKLSASYGAKQCRQCSGDKSIPGCERKQIGGVKIEAGKLFAKGVFQMAQKVCHIAVPLVKGKPDHIVPFTGILHHEGGFAIDVAWELSRFALFTQNLHATHRNSPFFLRYQISHKSSHALT